MFESLAVRTTAPFRTRLDLGEIAEALLFYRTVHLFLSEVGLAELAQRVGLDTAVALLENGYVRVTLLRDNAATHTVGVRGSQTYDFITVQPVKTKGNLREPEEIVAAAFFRATQRKGQSKRAARRFLKHASVESLGDSANHRTNVCDLSRKDVRDTTYVQLAISEAILALTGELPPPGWRFEVMPKEGRLHVSTNLDFARLTNRLRSRFGPGHTLTPAHLLDILHQARVDLFLATESGSELLTSPLSSTLIRHRLRSALQVVSPNSLDQIALFQEVVLQGRSIGDAVRSGHKTFDQVLRLVDSAAKFRSWIAERPPDATLLAGYYAAVTGGSWVDRLPGKHLRFAAFTGGGILADLLIPTGFGTAVGVGIGAIDAYLLERLTKGWKPSQFVDRDLIPFARQNQGSS